MTSDYINREIKSETKVAACWGCVQFLLLALIVRLPTTRTRTKEKDERVKERREERGDVI